jgi:very-short-patch-repair endonuclease
MRGSNRSAVQLKRRLRRQSTDAEMKLWFALRDRRLDGLKFVRQASIGRHVVDFVCRAARLAIEVDGGQHADSASDQVRDAFLTAEGYRVLRFWNSDVLRNIHGVLETIVANARSRD